MPEQIGVQDLIRREARSAGVPEELALAVAEQESSFNPTVRGPRLPSGEEARGTFQLLPSTARTLNVDPEDPVQNIRGGVTYLRQLLDRHQGDLDKVLAEYGGVKTNTTYVPGVIGRVSKFRQTTSPTPTRPITRLPVITQKELIQQIGQPPPGGPTAAPSPEPTSLLSTVTEGLDPRTRTGRRGLAGTAGGIAGGAGTGALIGTSLGPVGTAVGTLAGAVAGAAGGGALAETAERLVGRPPESVMAPEVTPAGAALEQGGYELFGHAFAWPVRAAGKRFMASGVARRAAKHFEDVLTGARDALQYARTAAGEALATAKETGTGLVTSAREAAAGAVGRVKEEAREAVGRAKTFAEAGPEAVRGRYERIATAPPTVTPRVAGERAQAVITGPARQARDEIGQMVEEAARTGPPVDITPLKAEAQRILAEEIRPAAQAFPKGVAAAGEEVPVEIAQLQALASSPALSAEAMAKMSPSQRAQAEAIHTALAQAQEAEAQTLLKHPAMQTLGRILSAEDTVPFEAAHLFKRELDDAIGTAWDRSVRNRVTNITKTLRGTLREQLGGHAPYVQATQAYQAIAPLYTKGLAPKLRRVAAEKPEALVRLVKPNDPTQLRMLKDLLVTQPGTVGAGKEGQFAWDSLRSAWTHENIIKGTIDKLDDRLAKLDPEFFETMYGDGPGQTVVNNLRSISTAYKQALESGAATVAESKDVARGAVGEAQRMARQAIAEAGKTARAGVRATREEGKQLVGRSLSELAAVRGEARTFARSTLVRSQGEVLADILRATALGPGSIWGALSTIRLLKGPSGADLVKYAAYSPRLTQFLVGALTGPAPDVAMASLVRTLGAGLGAGELLRGEGVGTPPPADEETAPRDLALVGAAPP